MKNLNRPCDFYEARELLLEPTRKNTRFVSVNEKRKPDISTNHSRWNASKNTVEAKV